MAYYRYDWDSDDINSQPAGFTKRWAAGSNSVFEIVANADAPKGKALRVTRQMSNERSLFAIDAPSADSGRDKFTLRGLIRIPDINAYSTTSGNGFWVVFRASGTSPNEYGYMGRTFRTTGEG